jgi:hypothetical protein
VKKNLDPVSVSIRDSHILKLMLGIRETVIISVLLAVS